MKILSALVEIKKEKQKLNFFRSALFHMKSRVCLKYFVNDCLWVVSNLILDLLKRVASNKNIRKSSIKKMKLFLSVAFQVTFACSKSTIEKLTKGVRFVQN